MATLTLAEKPSVGRYLTAGEHIITWGFGHLLTLAEPDAYDPGKRWAWETLPMLPDAFRVTPTAPGANQLAVIGGRLARPDVTRIIVATDPDREGGLIARWILRHLHATQSVERLWLSDNTPGAIRAGLAHRQPAHAYDGVAAAAEARAQADWLVGLSATRAVTLCHGTAGTGTLSVGRGQTPALAVIAPRNRQIADFGPDPSPACAPGAPGRAEPPTRRAGIPKTRPTRSTRAACPPMPPGTPGQVAAVDTQTVTRKPPPLFNLSDRQPEANQRLALSPQETPDDAQGLNEHRRCPWTA